VYVASGIAAIFLAEFGRAAEPETGSYLSGSLLKKISKHFGTLMTEFGMFGLAGEFREGAEGIRELGEHKYRVAFEGGRGGFWRCHHNPRLRRGEAIADGEPIGGRNVGHRCIPFGAEEFGDGWRSPPSDRWLTSAARYDGLVRHAASASILENPTRGDREALLS
jgi:hypothetical protein